MTGTDGFGNIQNGVFQAADETSASLVTTPPCRLRQYYGGSTPEAQTIWEEHQTQLL